MQWFINYQQDSVSPSDRGLAYGDGLFETIQASQQGFRQLDDHFMRLSRGLKKLAMPFSIEQFSELRAFLMQKILPLVQSASVVKVIVTRGEGGRGYLPPVTCTHNVFVGLTPAPNYQELMRSGVAIGVSDIPVSANPFLAGMKHLNRLENVLAKQRLRSVNFEDVMLNVHGCVVECIQSNIFWFKKGILYTPSLSQSGVQGIYRSRILKTQSLYGVVVGDFSLDNLKQADEIFITNSLMGIVPVISILESSIPIGINTQRLQQLMKSKDVHGIS
ncbi:MAG: aminodeoxychorismate lyase [Marinomonas sp.]